jgi:peptidoglycan hydrolase CwlO-like protein
MIIDTREPRAPNPTPSIKKGQLNQIKQQEKSIMGQLQNLEQDMVDKEKQIEILAARIHALEEDIKATEEEIAQKEEELQVQIDYLCERLLYMYEDGMDVSYLEVLFSATNIRDFLTRYDLLQYVVEQDMNLIDTINKNKRALDIKKNDLEIQKKELLTMREVQEAQRRQLEEQADQKKEILSNVRVEKKAYEKALEELERTSRELFEFRIELASQGLIGSHYQSRTLQLFNNPSHSEGFARPGYPQ